MRKEHIELFEKVKKLGQEQLLAFYEELSAEEQDALVADIESIDFALMKELFENAGKPTANNKDAVLSPIEAADKTNMSAELADKFVTAGDRELSKGRVAAVTMAGGQGSRLGHDGPKGTYDIGLPSHKSLFEIQCDGLKKISGKCGKNIPWYIMTSQINHADTVAFFKENNYFGYSKDDIFFFPQNMIPVVSMDGKLLLESKSKVLRSPDGNGGLFSAVVSSGALADMQKRGVKWVFICGIDNCLVNMVDPMFVGYTLESGVPASAKSFVKRSFDEKAGILCRKDGKPGVIEYTEVPEKEAKMTDENGCFVYGDANVLNYVFDISVLESIAGNGMCYHTACKKITYLNSDGEIVTSKSPDAYKFELFLFDAFDFIDDMRILRIDRKLEFAPVKNKEGEDSPAWARDLYMKANKIQMKTPLVEMDGDEMTRIVWKKIKDILLTPYIDLKTEYYDLGIENRDATDDQVTKDSANATKKYGVAVKCATITPNAARVKEFNLKKMYKSPNGTIRSILDGTVFRAPILADGISPLVKGWEKPIVIARHAYGDIYSAIDAKVQKGSTAELVITAPDGTVTKSVIHDFAKTDGIVMGMHNEDSSIEGFARACFEYAISEKMDLWFSSKDTISKTYDHHFKDIFNDLYENEYKGRFEALGITYFYTLIDDAIARVMKSKGGFIWACKNYDGDVFSDMLATAFGSLAMMTSVLVSPHGYFEYEAAHGTIPRHYHKYLAGEKTSTNPIATIFAWTGALAKRGEMDGIDELVSFAKRMEDAVLETVGSGYMTGDLALISELPEKHVLDLDEFLNKVASNL
ncbi:MAG: NADP-dependent isocitrate dehydrogenase [Ruminococcaceae bacterium]|nr:NADP-dependent isocitrate dehydrogenase [Oscillospiraceae bacterium]